MTADPDEPCIIPDCREPGIHNFGVRLRTPSTLALWAPNTNAYVCDFHAVDGMQIVVQLIPTRDQQIETIVHGMVAPTKAEPRVTEITS